MSQDVTSGHCPNVLNSNAYCKLCKQLSVLSVFILKVQSKNYKKEDLCTVCIVAFCQAYKCRLLDKIPSIGSILIPVGGQDMDHP